MTPIHDISLRCVWTGEAFVPRGSSKERAKKTWGEGEIVAVSVALDRSERSHRHFFAVIRELWLNLPERLAHMPYAANDNALRKHALIVTGFCDVQTVMVGNRTAAERVADLIRGLAGEYRISVVEGGAVKIFTPESQSYRAMGKKRFQESKDAVLGWCEALVRGDVA